MVEVALVLPIESLVETVDLFLSGWKRAQLHFFIEFDLKIEG